jgi:hypothetical protein
MTKKFPNSLCETKGHEWVLSVSQQFRLCGRERCKAMERLQDEHWIDATITRYPSKNPLAKEMQQARRAARKAGQQEARKTAQQQPEQPRQLDFLDECKRSAPLEIDLVSRQEIREALRGCYRLLGR